MHTTYVIGDIHGALKALIQVLEKVQPTTNDTFVFLGDYVDGWSESAQSSTISLILIKKTIAFL